PPGLAGAGPPYSAALVFWVAESEGDAADVFDDAVVAFAAGVGQSGLDGQDHRLLPCWDGAGKLADLGHRAGGAERLEPVQRSADVVGQSATGGAGQHRSSAPVGDPGGGGCA